MIWAALGVAAAGCYLLKLAGLSVPRHLLENARVERMAALLPVALLAALVAVQTVGEGGRLVLDTRQAGVAVAVVAIVLRAPFLVTVVAAAGATALLRVWLGGVH